MWWKSKRRIRITEQEEDVNAEEEDDIEENEQWLREQSEDERSNDQSDEELENDSDDDKDRNGAEEITEREVTDWNREEDEELDESNHGRRGEEWKHKKKGKNRI